MRSLLLVRGGLVVGVAAIVGTLGAASVAAVSKYKACSLLTAAEVEAVLKRNISKTDEGEVTIPDGPYKGEVTSGCTWIAGESHPRDHVVLMVRPGPRTPQERAKSQAITREDFDTLKKHGWSFQEKTSGGVECATGRPPPEVGNLSYIVCGAEKGGREFFITIMAGVRVSVEEVKALADKVASRIR